MNYFVLKKASFSVLSICGEQEYDENKEYKISKYVVTEKVDKGCLYHSCLTGELILIIDENLSKAYLIKHWFLVGEDIDEQLMAQKIKKLMRCLGKSQQLGYKTIEIITTTYCNARCYYCYEMGFPKMIMSKKTAEAAASFILKHKYNNNIHIRWYGGEPLMNISVINIIAEELIKNGVLLNSTMISNGYLFDDNIIKTAKELWHLTNVRITIDGTESKYNAVKNYKGSNGNAFRKIINNINCLIANGISVTIRLNIENCNIEDSRELINFICDEYSGNDLIDIMLRPLNNTLKNNMIESKGISRNNILDEIASMKKKLFDDGYNVNCGKLSGMTMCTCIADSDKYIVIKPNGDFAYCSTDFDRKSYGNLQSNILKISHPDISSNLYEKTSICDDCPIYPLCSPSKLCPSCLNPICNETQKQYNINDIKITMKQVYRKNILNI